MSTGTEHWDGRDRRRHPEVTRTIVLDAEHFDQAIGMLIDRQVEVRDLLAESRDSQATAIATALGAVLTDEVLMGRMMDVVSKVAAERTQRAAGRGLLGIVKAVFSKWLVVALLVILAAQIGGWQAVKAVGQFVAGKA